MALLSRVTISVLASVVVVACVTLGFISSTAWAGNCLDIGEHASYTCFFTRDDGFPTQQAMTTTITVPPSADRFYMLFLPSMEQVGCRCQAKGTAKKPKFGEDKDFLCGDSGQGDAAVGKVSGKSIKKGQYFSGGTGGHMWTFQCEPR